jgi:hypothetical protein
MIDPNDPSDDWQQRLDNELLRPPADFTDRVMARISISTLAIAVPLRTRQTFLRQAMRWLVLATGAAGAAFGGAFGATQLAGFILGIWAAVAAG